MGLTKVGLVGLKFHVNNIVSLVLVLSRLLRPFRDRWLFLISSFLTVFRIYERISFVFSSIFGESDFVFWKNLCYMLNSSRKIQWFGCTESLFAHFAMRLVFESLQ